MSLPAKLLAALVSALIFIGVGYGLGTRLTMARWNADKVAQSAANIKAIETARQEEKQNAQRIQDAQSNQVKALAVKAADTERATAERDSLRDKVRAFTNGADSVAAANQRAATIGELFNTCTAEYQSMGRAADGHAIDVKLLLGAWPR